MITEPRDEEPPCFAAQIGNTGKFLHVSFIIIIINGPSLNWKTKNQKG